MMKAADQARHGRRTPPVTRYRLTSANLCFSGFTLGRVKDRFGLDKIAGTVGCAKDASRASGHLT
jgi:hypothetical protein